VSIVVAGNRVRVYDSRGNLVEERDATLEDLKDIILKELAEKYIVEFEFTVAGQTIKVRAQLKRIG